ncbi:PREDICTED: ran GTPase-activating protein 1 [Papilio xuthus]|uniref:Ran GTPase-activating protein 1 n=1 Tax=Papilio xuthus TaxID=66420 RepID=A0AAJ6ZTI7_PAPXU|nr:PREDICTED: ran GTPase-activating protein 1 [Papilio xuthus]
MATFDFNSINSALTDTSKLETGVDFSGKSLKLDTEKDAQPIIDAINACPNLQYLTLTGNTLGVAAAQAIAKALEHHPELKIARFSDMFTGRMKTEIPPALSALGEGMITAGARLSVLELSDNAFGPIGVQGLAKLLQSDVCSQLQELRLNNNGLGIKGGRILAEALSASPRKLKVFIAGRNRLENDGATALARVFQDMGTLEEIAMPQNGIYHKGVSALSEAFKHNPNLSCLNLNDNTISSKGAKAIANVLPGLKKLKSINFGDCLLKSKGAKALAKAFKDNSMLLESVDLSFNEIGREACMEVVEAVTALPDATDRLSRVVLAGNSLGDSTNKKTMKDKLGPSAELSDGDCSDHEFVSGSESGSQSSEGSDDEEESEDSAPEDAQHINTIVELSREINLDSSGIEEVKTDVDIFLKSPTIENLTRLGTNAADVIDTHLQVIKDPSDLITAYVEATFSVSGLSEESQLAHQVALDLYPIMLKRAGQQHASAWLLANTMLRGLGLIKSENKQYRIRWKTSGCYRMLAIAVTSPTFPVPLRDTLRFFIASRLTSLADRTIVEQHPQLYTS